MERIRYSLPMVGLLFIIGLSGLVRFSSNVRPVQAVGLSGSGFALGVGFALLVMALMGRIKPKPAAE